MPNPGLHAQAGKVWRLHREGKSQRQIAAAVSLSQSTVNRVLSGPEPAVDDTDEVKAEYEQLYEASDNGSLDFYREMHRIALVCHANGYDVKWSPLRYLSALSQAENEATTREDRDAFRAETSQVYADIKDWRLRDVPEADRPKPFEYPAEEDDEWNWG